MKKIQAIVIMNGNIRPGIQEVIMIKTEPVNNLIPHSTNKYAVILYSS